MKNSILGGTQRAENAEVRFFEMAVIPTGQIKDYLHQKSSKSTGKSGGILRFLY